MEINMKFDDLGHAHKRINLFDFDDPLVFLLDRPLDKMKSHYWHGVNAASMGRSFSFPITSFLPFPLYYFLTSHICSFLSPFVLHILLYVLLTMQTEMTADV